KLVAGLPELTQVPYRGAGPVMADLISGQVVMGVVALTSQSLEFHRSGKLRVLGVTSPLRLTAAPELPTVADAGFPGLTNLQTIGLVAPAGTPKPIIELIAQAVRTALAEPAYQQKLIDSGFEASPDTTPEKFRRRLEADVVFWTPVVEALGLKCVAPGCPNHQVHGKSHETPPPKFSPSGRRRCRAVGRLAHRAGASLSVAAGALDRLFCGRRPQRHRGAHRRPLPVGSSGTAVCH